MTPGWPRMTQDDSGWLQDDPGWLQDEPGWLQDDSRMTPGWPRMTPEWPRMTPGWTRMTPGWPPKQYPSNPKAPPFCSYQELALQCLLDSIDFPRQDCYSLNWFNVRYNPYCWARLSPVRKKSRAPTVIIPKLLDDNERKQSEDNCKPFKPIYLQHLILNNYLIGISVYKHRNRAFTISEKLIEFRVNNSVFYPIS